MLSSVGPVGAAASTRPFVSSVAGGWRERYASVSDAAFRERRECDAHDERPLRALLVGHNPSDHAWDSGVGYSNPSNRFWKLLRQAEILPPTWRADETPTLWNNNMPGDLGIGITDYLCEPGSDAAAFPRSRMLSARGCFYERLAAHARRAGACPRVVVFVGKRQWAQQFEPPLKRVEAGLQDLRPPGWPFRSPLPVDGDDTKAACDVFVLTSPSGRAAVSPEVRLGEYKELSRLLRGIAWPLDASCGATDQMDMARRDEKRSRFFVD